MKIKHNKANALGRKKAPVICNVRFYLIEDKQIIQIHKTLLGGKDNGEK